MHKSHFLFQAFIFFAFQQLVTPSLVAQERYRLSLFNTNQQVFSQAFYLESVQDARKDTFLIGLVSDKTGAIKEPAVFDGPLRKECLFALRTLAEPAPDKRPVRMHIQHIFIDEFVNVSVGGVVVDGRATVQLSVSFELFNNNNWQEVFKTNVFLVRKGPIVHLLHPFNVSEALAACWEKFSARAQSGKMALQAGRAMDTSLVRPRGVYPSYYDFVYQTPDSLDISNIKYERGATDTVASASLMGYSETPHLAPWGFSDGHQLFVLHQNRYMPVFRHQGGLGIKGESPDDLSSMLVADNLLSWPGVLGRQVSPMLYLLSAVGRAAALGIFETTDNMQGTYLLDLETGAPYYSPTTGIEVTTVHILASDLLLDEARVQILIDGKEACTLAPGQLYSLKIRSDHVHPLLEVRCGNNRYRTYLYPFPGGEVAYLVRQTGKRKLSADILYEPGRVNDVIGKVLWDPPWMQAIHQGKHPAPCAEGKR